MVTKLILKNRSSIIYFGKVTTMKIYKKYLDNEPKRKHSKAQGVVAKLAIGLALIGALGCTYSEQKVADNGVEATDKVAQYWPKLPQAIAFDEALELKISNLISEMTLEQKISQMIQPEIRDITVEDMRQYGFGSYLNGGGSFPDGNKHATPQDWIKLAEDMYQASIDTSLDGSAIPTMWGTDAVHGHNNVIGATLFPHNIGLGAANNPDLIEKISAITAAEVMVTGIDWVFAPTVAVVQDDRWGRTYEGYSEDPTIVRNYASAVVKGLQGLPGKDFLSDDRVISTVKHFLGDGGTVAGDDQGDNVSTEQQLFEIHAQGYIGGLNAGAQSVMASFNSWHGKKNHGNKYLLTDVLKDRMGFDGFVVGDWNGHGQVKDCTNESCPQSVNAGLDIFMVPTDAWKPLYENTIKQVKSGEIAQSRIDDAVSRILRVKLRAGLFEKPSPAARKLSGKTELIGQVSHREVARQAVRESLVLLKNNHNILPLSPTSRILVAGDAADNIGKQSGGWSITWQGTGNKNADFPGAKSIYDGIQQQVSDAGGTAVLSVDGSFVKKPDVAVVVFGEEPYAEGHGDRDNLEFQRGNKKDLAILRNLKQQGIPVVAVFISGRPMWVNAELNASDAFVAAWLPGTEGHGVAEVLLKNSKNEVNHDFVGRLSFSWPATAEQTATNHYDANYQPLFKFGYGLNYQDTVMISNDFDETLQVSHDELASLVLFAGAAKMPWKMQIKSGEKEADIISSAQSLGAITFHTLDKIVQEDARTVTFDGSDQASINLSSNFPEDLRAYIEAGATLSFAVKVNSLVNDPVLLSMSCEQACPGTVNITKALSTLELNKWDSIAIDLQCFESAGVDFSQVTSPFNLASKGTASLSFADISIVPNSTELATVRCQQ
jgi:beta-glucosidase